MEKGIIISDRTPESPQHQVIGPYTRVVQRYERFSHSRF